MIGKGTPVETVAALQVLLAPGVGPKAFKNFLAKIDNEGISLADAVEIPTADLAIRFELSVDVASHIAAERAAAQTLAEQLARHEIGLLIYGKPGYPERLERVLGDAAPSWLFVNGSAALLDSPAVAFSGSRHSSERGLEFASQCAGQLAKEGVNVVSGHASGIDCAAHHAALAAGGTTTFVLAEDILRFHPKGEIGSLLSSGNFLVVSEFKPGRGWTAYNAMQRNATICGLADVTVVVEAGATGGSLAMGETAIRLGQPLLVMDYEDPPQSAAGNSLLLANGGHPFNSTSDIREAMHRNMKSLNTNDPKSMQSTQTKFW